MSDFITPLSPEYSIAVPQGLMTWLAYGLWFGLILLAAALGICVALSQLGLAIGVTLLALITLRGINVLERWLERHRN